MKHTLSVLLLLLAWNVAANKVDNFALIDHVGDAHELYYYSDAEAVVLMVQGNGCALVRAALPDYRALRERFQDENVVFAMLNSNLQDTRDAIAAEAEEWDIDFPILMDETQLVGMDLELTRTAEMFVIDTDGWSVAFRGPINDRFEYERQRETAEQEYVADAITAVLAGEAPAVSQVEAKGCLINFPDRENDATRDLLQRRHRADSCDQLHGLSHRRRHRTLRYVELRNGARFLAHDARGTADETHAAVAR